MFKVASLNGNGANQTLLSMNNLVEGNIHGGIINNTTGTKQNVTFIVGTVEFPLSVDANGTTPVSKINVPSDTTVQVNAPIGVNVSISYIETAADASAALTTIQGLVSEADTSATNAGISETNANNSAINANLSAENANESETNASNSEIMANKWAVNPEDTEVLTGQFSAYHWARKAQAVASGDVIDDTEINNLLTWSSTKINSLDVANVKLSGDQTVAGVKTFSSSPIVPTPTTDFQVATKKYVDDEVTGANNYTDTRVNEVVRQLSTDYYQGPYGISWDYATDTYIRTGAKGYTSIQSKMRRCVVKADGTVNYYLNPDNSNFKEDGTPSVLTGADGNVMVEIPKHYIKVETVGDVDSFSISLTPEAGYVLDPAFLKWNGTAMVEVPYRYFRAYEGFVSGGKLLSVSGVTPTRSQTIATFRTQAMANGAGWHLTDWNLLNTIKRLCYIEFCDFIVTKYLGNGNDTGTDYGITTGQSNALGNRSSNSTHNDKYMSYRGIENMYADIWEFVDGVNVNNYQFYVNGNYSTFQSDVFTGDYVAKGPLVAGASNSLIKRCAISSDGGFIPTVVGGSTTTFYGDALWSPTGARVVIYGGAANYGALGGLGALALNVASSDSNADFGAALCR